MSINWFPGHMVKARREIQENAAAVDLVIEVLDARAPRSTLNPDLPGLVKGKPIIRVLNKSDLADERATRRFIDYFEQEGVPAVGMDSLTGQGAREVLRVVRDAFRPVAEQLRKRRARVRPARVMVAGAPNTGKSSFINALVGKKTVKTGARPGITRGKQWIRVRREIELLDTPGIMWPRVDSEEQGLRLALLAVVGEASYQEEEIAWSLIKTMQVLAPEALRQRYRLEEIHADVHDTIEQIGQNRGLLLKGGVVDTTRTARMLIDEYRRGSLGRFTLDEV